MIKWLLVLLLLPVAVAADVWEYKDPDGAESGIIWDLYVVGNNPTSPNYSASYLFVSYQAPDTLDGGQSGYYGYIQLEDWWDSLGAGVTIDSAVLFLALAQPKKNTYYVVHEVLHSLPSRTEVDGDEYNTTTGAQWLHDCGQCWGGSHADANTCDDVSDDCGDFNDPDSCYDVVRALDSAQTTGGTHAAIDITSIAQNCYTDETPIALMIRNNGGAMQVSSCNSTIGKRPVFRFYYTEGGPAPEPTSNFINGDIVIKGDVTIKGGP